MGIELAKSHCKLMFQQIQNFIDMNQIVASGPFLQVFLEEVFDKALNFIRLIKLKFVFFIQQGITRQLIFLSSIYFKTSCTFGITILLGFGNLNFKNCFFALV